MRFHTTVEQSGKSATGVHVPDDVVAALGGSKRPAVQVTINGYYYRTTVVRMGGRFMFPLSAEHRTASGLSGGDAIEVEIVLDTAPREVTVPVDLADALGQAPDARRFFDGLSYSHKRWFVLSVEEAKKADTRQRRIDKALVMLSEGRRPG